MTAETLSRIQFALTASFHFLFPPMTIGLGVVLIVIQGLRLWTGKQVYLDLARFWTRVFGLIFAIEEFARPPGRRRELPRHFVGHGATRYAIPLLLSPRLVRQPAGLV
jgi:hypothetical protein